MRMVREEQYDLIVGNPPYQGTSKMADNAYIEKHYPRGKVDLYAAFLERGQQLLKEGGTSALITMRGWLFLAQFTSLRHLLSSQDIRLLADLGWGAFRDMKDNPVTMSIVGKTPSGSPHSIALSPADPVSRTRTAEHFQSIISGLLSQSERYEFTVASLAAVPGNPLIYWWSREYIEAYRAAPKLGDVAPVQQGMKTSDNVRFLLRPWEVRRSELVPTSPFPQLASWAPCVRGAIGKTWFEPLDFVLRWKRFGLEIKALNEHLWGTYTRNITSEEFYFRPGIAFSMIGKDFRVRAHRFPSVFLDKGSSLFAEDTEAILCALNSTEVRTQLSALNPSISFQVGDVRRVALPTIHRAKEVVALLRSSFTLHETAREPSYEFRRPGPSSWQAAQQWAQEQIDKNDESASADVVFALESERGTDHLSFAVGVALGRFSAKGDGVLSNAPATSLPYGILYVSDASEEDSLATPAAKVIVEAWAQHGSEIDESRTLRDYLRDRFFIGVHRPMYENRPIYFPLSSARRTFVAYVSIHRWSDKTLTDLLAEHLLPERKRLAGRKADLVETSATTDKKAAREAARQLDNIADWLEEIDDFIAKVQQIGQKGPPPIDARTASREAEAPFVMDLDDGVMINSAALWPLLEPQWKDPKKWWKELANAEGKKDYDWAHLAARYFPSRVDAKCKLDPSLAVAHGCFWKYHPEKAYQWELRLQDEVRPDFTIDEAGSDEARAKFEAEHADKVEELVTKEHQRRERKRAKATGGRDDEQDAQGELDLDADAGVADSEEMSA